MQYDLNQLANHSRFQRLVNALLTARFGEDARLTPLLGADGGADGETAPGNPHMEFQYDATQSNSSNSPFQRPRPGRYVFQAKYHRAGDQRPTDIRATVLREFKNELELNVLSRTDRRDLNYFFLVTNITASKDAIAKIDNIRKSLLTNLPNLHADVWWGEKITADLDWAHDLWLAYPEIFPGGTAPFLSRPSGPARTKASRTVRTAISQQYNRDREVKFRQIKLQQKLLDLFVDLDVEPRSKHSIIISHLDNDLMRNFDNDENLDFFEVAIDHTQRSVPLFTHSLATHRKDIQEFHRNLPHPHSRESALNILINDQIPIPRVLLEGGPGQGKSTITQMAAQIYREKILHKFESEQRDETWHEVSKIRFPIRLDLQMFSNWISSDTNGTLEEFIAFSFGRDAGGASLTVDDLHECVEYSSVILILDGLDEIGNDSSRDRILDEIMATIDRFEDGLQVDLRVVLTTRPPAITGRRTKLKGFTQVLLAPMRPRRIDEYVKRWLDTQVKTEEDKKRVSETFFDRRDEPHVHALARNPMQLSVLLQLIYLKGQAFPHRRAELYREYFQIVIDRDVEKSPELRDHRDVIEGLHSFLGFQLHGKAEIDRGRRTLSHREAIELSEQWLEQEGHPSEVAGRFFALGEERFGLIVALSGEGVDSIYGFEVQPIQEFFAALYISNILADGIAHDVFELLVQRSYWREVSLFLAGLRRRNEKADLIARARSADRDMSQESQRNGRSIVIQLLRDGVLDSPRHVLNEAMEFVLDLIDIRLLTLHRNSDSLIEAILELGKRHPNNVPHDQIDDLVNEYADSDDHYALSLVFRLARTFLDRDRYVDHIFSYRGTTPDQRAFVRFDGLARCGGVLTTLTCDASFWNGVSSRVWARHIWRSALESSVVTDVTYPRDIHGQLVAEFTVAGFPGGFDLDSIVEVQAGEPLAVWKLQQDLQILCNANVSDSNRPQELRVELERSWTQISESQTHKVIRYESLPLHLANCLRDLLDCTRTIIEACGHGDRVCRRDDVVRYIDTIYRYLQDTGISALVACRCAVALFRSQLLGTVGEEGREILAQIRRSLCEYYGMDKDFSSRRSDLQLGGFLFCLPYAVRIEDDGPLVPFHEIIVDLLLDNAVELDEHLLAYIDQVPLSGSVVKSVVESSDGDEQLRNALRFIGQRIVFDTPIDSRLRVQFTRRILTICRNVVDADILRGASSMLANSRFLAIADSAVILKILMARPSDKFIHCVMDSSWLNVGQVEGSRRRGEVRLSRTVAQGVLASQERFPLSVVRQAVEFVAEAEGTDSLPLFEEHSDLANIAGG